MFSFRDKTLPVRSEVRPALTQIYGLGWRKANTITEKIGLSYPFFMNNLNTYTIDLILYLLKGLVISDTRIRRVIDLNITRLTLLRSYKGMRHVLTLPVRGQRTRTNAGTQRRKKRKNENIKK